MGSPATNLHGPALIGIFVNMFLYGIAVLQTFDYYQRYPNDRMWLKVFVAALMTADTLNSIFATWWIYDNLVIHFGDDEELLKLNWLLGTDPAMVGTIAIMCQAFFAWKVKVLSGSKILYGFIMLCGLVTFCGGVAFAISLNWFYDLQRLAQNPSARVLASVWLAPAAIGDLTITITLTYLLQRARTGIRATDTLLSKIVRNTVQNGLTTTVLASLDLFTFLFMESGIHIGFSYPLPKVYTNSVLSSLNARKVHRMMQSGGAFPTIGGTFPSELRFAGDTTATNVKPDAGTYMSVEMDTQIKGPQGHNDRDTNSTVDDRGSLKGGLTGTV